MIHLPVEMVMKSFVAVFLFIVGSQAQFHQDSYHITHDRIEIIEYNHKYIVNPIITIANVSNNKQALSASARFTLGAEKQVIIKAELSRFVSNKYRPFPVNLTMDLCEEYDKKAFGIDTAVQLSNFRGCPCPAGEYWIRDVVPEEEKFPPHLPLGKYKLAVHVHNAHKNIFIGRGFWYGAIVPKNHKINVYNN